LKLSHQDLFSPWIPREQGAALKRRAAYQKEHPAPSAMELSGPIQLEASMPGKIIKVSVCNGDDVKVGQALVVLEAMKMEHSISAPRDGTVKKVHVEEGRQVGMGELLVELD